MVSEDVIVAKFYCDSFFIPPWMYEDGLCEYRLSRQAPLSEEMAYEAPKYAQGRWVPYFLGRHKVRIIMEVFTT